MSKKCVFCGNKPESKNKEHIIPKWLIELTGDPKRQFYLSSTLQKGNDNRQFAADQFVFPACEDCNSFYSELEGLVHKVYLKLRNYEYISSEELITFLDWLDKVRIGLWLGYLQLDKNPLHIEPKFYIDTRISQSDRSLYISDLGTDWHGVNFFLSNYPIYYSMPSTLLLRIENFCFLSISNHELNSRRMGFPYHTYSVINHEDSNYFTDLQSGINRIMKPVLNFSSIISDIEFHQSILAYGNKVFSKECDEYISKHTYDKRLSNILQGKYNEYSWIKGFQLDKIKIDDLSSGLKYRKIVINSLYVQLKLFDHFCNNFRSFEYSDSYKSFNKHLVLAEKFWISKTEKDFPIPKVRRKDN